MKRFHRVALGCSVTMASLFFCGSAPQAVAAPQEAGGVAAPAAEKVFRGKVTETMDAGRYTYVRVENGTEGVWAAAMKFDVKVGEEVGVPIGLPMKDFESPTLKRKFDLIYFVAGVIRDGDKETGGLPAGHVPVDSAAKALPDGHPQLGATGPLPEGHPAIGAGRGASGPAATGAGPRIKGVVKETMDAGRYTYILLRTGDGADVWAAAPKREVAVGDQVSIPEGMPMKDFESTSLKRKFALIYFVDSAEVEKSSRGAAGKPPSK